MCLRLIAAILLSALFFYGAKSQQANSNIAKQKRSQTATWLEIPKAPLDLPITCLLPWRHGMRTHSQRRVPGKRRGWLKCEASSDLLLLQSVTTAAVLALLAVPCSITKARKTEYLSQPCCYFKIDMFYSGFKKNKTWTNLWDLFPKTLHSQEAQGVRAFKEI